MIETGEMKYCFHNLQEELDSLAANYPDRFKVYYVLNQVIYHPFQCDTSLSMYISTFLTYRQAHLPFLVQFFLAGILFYLVVLLVLVCQNEHTDIFNMQILNIDTKNEMKTFKNKGGRHKN